MKRKLHCCSAPHLRFRPDILSCRHQCEYWYGVATTSGVARVAGIGGTWRRVAVCWWATRGGRIWGWWRGRPVGICHYPWWLKYWHIVQTLESYISILTYLCRKLTRLSDQWFQMCAFVQMFIVLIYYNGIDGGVIKRYELTACTCASLNLTIYIAVEFDQFWVVLVSRTAGAWW